MKQYLELMQKIKDKASKRDDRTGVGTTALFGAEMRFNLNSNTAQQIVLPLLTTKKVFTRGLIEELLWFIKGSTNNEKLVAENVHIWDSWALPEDVYEERQRTAPELAQALADKLQISLKEAIQKLMDADKEYSEFLLNNPDVPPGKDEQVGAFKVLSDNGVGPTHQVKIAEKGALGPIYGSQWRNWKCSDGRVIDQLGDLVKNLKTRPFSRRHIVTAWNPEDLPDESKSPHQNIIDGRQSLASCHCLFQMDVEPLTPSDFYNTLFKRGYTHEANDFNLLIVSKDQDAIKQYMKDAAEKWNMPLNRLSCKLTQRKLHCAF